MTIRLADPPHDFLGILAVVNAFEETPVEQEPPNLGSIDPDLQLN